MLLSYRDCVRKYGGKQQMKEALQSGQLYEIESGIYADDPNVSEQEIISFKNDLARSSLESIFYCGL